MTLQLSLKGARSESGAGRSDSAIPVWRELSVGCRFHSRIRTPSPGPPQSSPDGLGAQHSRLS